MVFCKQLNSEMNISKIVLLSAIVFSSVWAMSCSSTKNDIPQTAEAVFNEGLMRFKDESFMEAQKLFDVIKLQYPASAYADDAQYYLAEINFKRKEYQLSAFNYNMLRRVYPRSEYSKEALFKTGLAYYHLSPTYDREQEHTLKAIQTFSEFQATYPQDSLSNEVTNYILELREKLAYKEYFSGLIYQKMSYFKSALIYYNFVLDDYSDTKVTEDAYIGKMQVLLEMEKKEELKITLELFEKAYPNTKFANELNSIKAEM